MRRNAKKVRNRSYLLKNQARERLDKISSQNRQVDQMGLSKYEIEQKEKKGLKSWLSGLY